MSKRIGKVAATEKAPTTIDEFFFWTDKRRILHPFDVVAVRHLHDSFTFGVVEEISHITDAASYLTSYISNDFGDVDLQANTHRIGMNYVKARVVGNTANIYTPVLDGSEVCLAAPEQVREALGLAEVKNPLPCGYLEMYEGDDKITLPVHLNSHFLIGPEGAHLNISGISGLAAKTSYTMFLLKAIQQHCLESSTDDEESIAYVIFNVKGRDLLAIDEPNTELSEKDNQLYQLLDLNEQPFQNVTYFYPYGCDDQPNTYAQAEQYQPQFEQNKAFQFKYIYEFDKNSLELLFSNIDDTSGTMDSIINYIVTEQGEFGNIRNWQEFISEIDSYCQKQSGKNSDVNVISWRKFKRIIRRPLTNPIFAKRVAPEYHESRLREHICDKIQKNDVFVVDIARLDEYLQAYVFGDVIRAIYDLKLGQAGDREEDSIPSKIVVFVDELNKYASTDVPKNSPILRQIIDITERGRSLGIILFRQSSLKAPFMTE